MSTHEHIYIIGKRLAATAALVGLFAKSALAGNVVCAAQPVLDSGNTAWMIVATALVLLMSIPGIAFQHIVGGHRLHVGVRHGL